MLLINTLWKINRKDLKKYVTFARPTPGIYLANIISVLRIGYVEGVTQSLKMQKKRYQALFMFNQYRKFLQRKCRREQIKETPVEPVRLEDEGKILKVFRD